MHKLKNKVFKLAAILLVASVLAGLPALAYSPTGVKVAITAQRQDDILTVSLQMRDVAFNVMSIVLGYDPAILTPVRADGTAVETAHDAFDIVAPLYEAGGWSGPASGWLTPVEPGIQMDQAAGALQYSFYVEPGGEGVDPDTKCISAPASGTDILKLHFKVKEQSTLRYSSIRLGSNAFGSGTGIQILDSQMNEITTPAAVQIDLTNVAQPDVETPGGGDSGSSNKPSEGGGQTEQPPADQDAELKDVSGHWAEKEIKRLAEAGVITGDSQNNFHPNQAVTRAEVAAMCARAYRLTVGASAVSFTDISGHWAETEILACAQQGYFLGASGAFFPGNAITREELAVVVARIKGLTPEGRPDYTDGAQCSPWAAGAIAAVQKTNLMTGLSDGSFRPHAVVTRAEAAVMIVRCLGE